MGPRIKGESGGRSHIMAKHQPVSGKKEAEYYSFNNSNSFNKRIKYEKIFETLGWPGWVNFAPQSFQVFDSAFWLKRYKGVECL